MMFIRRLFGCATVLLACGVAGGPAQAAAYPAKPVTIVVPFAAGGPTDTSARVVAEALAKRLGTPVVVENVPGAGSVVGTTKVANAAPDGYTLLWGTASSLAIAPHFNQAVKYDPNTSFAPISEITAAPFVLAVTSKSKISTLDDLVSQAKAAPEKLNYGSTGAGGSAHMISELFNSQAGIRTVHIPYNGGAPMMHALLAGDVDFIFDTPTTIVPMVQGQRVVPLAVTSLERWPALPQVKTLDELGLQGFDATTWFGLLAPRGTPDERIRILNEKIVETLQDSSVARTLQEAGFFVHSSTPQAFAKKIRDEGERWGDIIRTANIRIQ
ncbi:tripartite tricarboxylate transporter substrate binding protein [Bordetella sp. BOR01]|uniref:Bug family tripartite tricarboxylate transporter substrate binding protein n=1 Tax=Bordetella sp. BOR01 TaxID=2854779 RepID=UPI001C484B76|nr:tripartite tricarboxylate transporter substrate binding protein [Bordetella sp. BOR01]MBV7485465.1 tripartite tricarboxylate transporter substrate binding protein [Bordetella sp. BOR01]